MNYYYIMRSLLFEGLTRDEVKRFLEDIGAEVVRFEQGEYVYRFGETATRMGLILSGSVRVEHTDVWGEVSIISVALPGKTVGEAYSCLPGRPIMMDIVAHEDCELLMIDTQLIMNAYFADRKSRRRVANNLTKLIALRNFELSRRVFTTAPKTIRGKVLSYLSLQATEQGSSEFDIPLNREQMANYFGVDRSALSAELGRMAKKGDIAFRKNHFVLYVRDADEGM